MDIVYKILKQSACKKNLTNKKSMETKMLVMKKTARQEFLCSIKKTPNKCKIASQTDVRVCFTVIFLIIATKGSRTIPKEG